ncbi:N-acetylmuramoyl-L-alanine amidase [Chthoniobacter flavus]|uniref:N-acetylmuramoyl-L-alanine amidase family protein n=1 Tax=Chthoniobacter flavus TaxID=191863 RepID=UPI00104EB4FA|nr:N-acetylmuramoyl-L-alanine amidase [Chthoniobacter flavus]TCO83591.1 N-acetylmuramoyl-L-alanine amidase [Chthoniobacter flavus]
MPRALLLGIALLLCIAASSHAQWTLYKISGRDYVPLENVANFYGLGHVQHVGNATVMELGGRSLKGSVGSVEFFINRLKFNLSYPITEYGGVPVISRMDLTKVIEPVLRPQKIKNAELVDTIVLDAGHGGHDNGATSLYGNEKSFTLDVVNRARMLLMQAGYRVVLTRSNDTFIPLEDRCRIANQYANALFISVHFNSGGAGTGLETYTLAPRGVPSMMADGPRISDFEPCAGNINDSENIALATATHASLVVRSRMYDRGIKRARFVVIRDITIPGVLIEGGFLSNDYDARLIATPAYRQQMAMSILQAVQNYRRAVGPQTPSETVAHNYVPESPRVETNTPMLRGGNPTVNEAQPTVITNAAGAN